VNPQGDAQDVHRFSSAHGCAVEKSRRRTRTRSAWMHEGRVAWGVLSFGDLFLTTGILPFALRASCAVRAAPAAQWTSKEKSPGRFADGTLLI